MASSTHRRLAVIGAIGTVLLMAFFFVYTYMFHVKPPKSHSVSTNQAMTTANTENQTLKILQGMDDVTKTFDESISNVTKKQFTLNKSLVSSAIYQQAEDFYVKNYKQFSSEGVTTQLYKFTITKQTYDKKTNTGQISCNDVIYAYVQKSKIAEIDNSFSVSVQKGSKYDVIVGYKNLSSQIKKLS